jgi:hypothetical protein
MKSFGDVGVQGTAERHLPPDGGPVVDGEVLDEIGADLETPPGWDGEEVQGIDRVLFAGDGEHSDQLATVLERT